MKVFLSWSGNRSQAMAKAINDFLPLVLHNVQSWASESDILPGDRWSSDVAVELDTTNFGILCLTPENLRKPWLLFEAGALSKSATDGKVVPLLLNVETKDLPDPLTQFQARNMDRDGIFDVVTAINQVSGAKVQESKVLQLFEALWPKLEKCIDEIPAELELENDSLAKRVHSPKSLAASRLPDPIKTPKLPTKEAPLVVSSEEESGFLGEYPDWDVIERIDESGDKHLIRELHRIYAFPSYDIAMRYMLEVSGQYIAKYNHHPRWQNSYNRVEVWLTTSNVNHQLSNRDLRLARGMEQIWQNLHLG